MSNSKRWITFIVVGITLSLCGTGGIGFMLAHRARSEAAIYLRIVAPMPIGAAFDAVVKQLRDAGLALDVPSGCQSECTLNIRFENKWQYTMHLAPPTGLVGRLDFQSNKLIYKSTTMGQGLTSVASVTEQSAAISKVKIHQNKIVVDLSTSDFSDTRKLAYDFNLVCIGSQKACKSEDLLPTINELERATSRISRPDAISVDDAH